MMIGKEVDPVDMVNYDGVALWKIRAYKRDRHIYSRVALSSSTVPSLG
jgi:hypothetical protein